MTSGQKNSSPVFEGIWLGRVGSGALSKTRTWNRQVRNLVLCPVELRGQRGDDRRALTPRFTSPTRVGPMGRDAGVTLSKADLRPHPTMESPIGSRSTSPEYTTPLVTGQKIPHQIFGGLDV